MFTQDFTGIDEGLNNLSLTGQDVVKSVKNVLQMMFTVLQSHSVSIRPRDLVLVTEGIGQLRRYVRVGECIVEPLYSGHYWDPASCPV